MISENVLVNTERIEVLMERDYETYFWIQKKDPNGKNIVIVNGAFATFEQMPDEVRVFQPNSRQQYQKQIISQTKKIKISYYLSHRPFPAQSNNYMDVQTIYIDGCVNDKDSSNRNISYNFIFKSSRKIESDVLEIVEKEFLKCLDMSGVLESFDADDFHTSMLKVDVKRINNWKSNLVKREFGTWFNKENLKEGCIAAALIMVPAIATSLFKKKRRKK